MISCKDRFELLLIFSNFSLKCWSYSKRKLNDSAACIHSMVERWPKKSHKKQPSENLLKESPEQFLQKFLELYLTEFSIERLGEILEIFMEAFFEVFLDKDLRNSRKKTFELTLKILLKCPLKNFKKNQRSIFWKYPWENFLGVLWMYFMRNLSRHSF